MNEALELFNTQLVLLTINKYKDIIPKLNTPM